MFMGGGSAALMIGASVVLAFLWPHVVSTLSNALHAVTYACQAVWQDLTRAQLAFASLSAGALLGFLSWVGYTAFRAIRLSKRLAFPRQEVPVRVLSIAADAGLDPSRLTVVQDARAFAMTTGVRWPEVFLSTAALRTLSQAQLRAVLEHEAHHVREREPLRRLVLALALLWVPFRRLRDYLRNNYVTASELEADERVHDQHVLGAALLRLVAPPIAAAGFSPLDARVERLVNPAFRHTGKPALRFALLAVVAVVGLAVLAPHAIATVYGGHPSSTMAAHLDMCRVEHERMLQSREGSCGQFSTPQTCATK